MDARKCCILCGFACEEKKLACNGTTGKAQECARSRVHSKCETDALQMGHAFQCPEHNADTENIFLEPRVPCTVDCFGANTSSRDIFVCTQHRNLICSHCNSVVTGVDHVSKSLCQCTDRLRKHNGYYLPHLTPR